MENPFDLRSESYEPGWATAHSISDAKARLSNNWGVRGGRRGGVAEFPPASSPTLLSVPLTPPSCSQASLFFWMLVAMLL